MENFGNVNGLLKGEGGGFFFFGWLFFANDFTVSVTFLGVLGSLYKSPHQLWKTTGPTHMVNMAHMLKSVPGTGPTTLIQRAWSLFACLLVCLLVYLFFVCVCVFLDEKNCSCNFEKEMHTTTTLENKTPIYHPKKYIMGLPFDNY